MLAAAFCGDYAISLSARNIIVCKFEVAYHAVKLFLELFFKEK